MTWSNGSGAALILILALLQLSTAARLQKLTRQREEQANRLNFLVDMALADLNSKRPPSWGFTDPLLTSLTQKPKALLTYTERHMTK